jgi:hypothetical protein
VNMVISGAAGRPFFRLQGVWPEKQDWAYHKTRTFSCSSWTGIERATDSIDEGLLRFCPAAQKARHYGGVVPDFQKAGRRRARRIHLGLLGHSTYQLVPARHLRTYRYSRTKTQRRMVFGIGLLRSFTRMVLTGNPYSWPGR